MLVARTYESLQLQHFGLTIPWTNQEMLKHVHAIIIIIIITITTTTILIADNKITFYNAMKLTLLMNTIQKVMNIKAGFAIFYCLGHLFFFFTMWNRGVFAPVSKILCFKHIFPPTKAKIKHQNPWKEMQLMTPEALCRCLDCTWWR